VAVGLLFLNDIKSVEGDRRLGLQSLTVAFGPRRTLLVSFAIIGLCQLALIGLALAGGYLWAAALVVVGVLVPLASQARLYGEPTHHNFQRYMIVNNPFIIIIQVVSAFIVGGYLG
jgi:chlorophyll synthase/bacteriochlorophyll c synthase